MFEILLFTVIFIVIASVLAGLIFLSGQSINLSLGDSWYLSVIALAVFFPAVMNFIIFFNRKSEEDLTRRLFALFRGFGMTIIGIIFLCLLFINNFPKAIVFGGFVFGAILWWGLLPFEDRYQSKKYEMANQSTDPADAAQQRAEDK